MGQAALLPNGEQVQIPLTQGKFAVIDADDLQRVMDYGNWVVMWSGHYWYARCNPSTLLHRFIMRVNEIKGWTQIVDHKNRDGLDCRKLNLQVTTPSVNAFNSIKRCDNTSGERGVYWDSARGLWEAKIKIQYRSKSLGRFVNFEDAVMARKRAEQTYLGAV